MIEKFSGSPRRYLRLSIWSTVGMVTWLYGMFAGIQYFAYGQTWPFGWKPIVITLAFAAWFARFNYRTMMRLDARYGAGRGWSLMQQTVKLPEIRSRSKQHPPCG